MACDTSKVLEENLMATEKALRRRDFLVASGAGVGAAKTAKLTAQSPIAVEKSSRIFTFSTRRPLRPVVKCPLDG